MKYYKYRAFIRWKTATGLKDGTNFTFIASSDSESEAYVDLSLKIHVPKEATVYKTDIKKQE